MDNDDKNESKNSIIKGNETKEESRYENIYKKKKLDKLFIEPIHWLKWDDIKTPTHCHTYTIKCLRGVSNKRVLDIGCGTGTFSVMLAKRGAIVEGFDISSEAIEIAKKRALINDVQDKVRFQQMSLYDMDYPNNSFDIIVGMSILHHIEGKKILADSLYKILKPDGKVIFREPFGNSRVLEKLRLLIPVPIDEEDKTHWDEQIKYTDIEPFQNNFRVEYKEFHLFSRLDRIIKVAWIIKLLGIIDLTLLENISLLRKYARDIVIILNKDNV